MPLNESLKNKMFGNFRHPSLGRMKGNQSETHNVVVCLEASLAVSVLYTISTLLVILYHEGEYSPCHYTTLSKKSGYTFTQRQRRRTFDGRKTRGCAAMTMCTGRRHHEFDLCHDRFTRVLPMQHVSRLPSYFTMYCYKRLPDRIEADSDQLYYSEYRCISLRSCISAIISLT